eukprot:GEMP01012385.1.p1 GENE.GEMP01012385.1~~GEMP01012385.1.p1  ORF type:complete len:495 (+),score=85.31 GEMP01012385.1:24-1508(+)
MVLSYPAQLTTIAVLGSFTFGYGISGMNASAATIALDLGWGAHSNLWAGMVNGAMSLGAAVGANIAGSWVKGGRRLLILKADTVLIVASILCASPFGPPGVSFAILLFGRSMMGGGIGMLAVGIPMYISESTPKSRRGYFGVFHQITISFGIFSAVVLGLGLESIPSNPEANFTLRPFDRVWWRLMQLFSMVPICLQMFYLMVKYPNETATFNIANGKAEQARDTLHQIYPTAEADAVYDEMHKDLVAMERTSSAEIPLLTALKSNYYRAGILVGPCLCMAQQFSGINMVIANSNLVFADAGIHGMATTWASSGVTFLNFAVTIAAVPLIETKGRRPLLLISYIGQTACISLACLLTLVAGGTQFTAVMIVICTCFFVSFFALAAGPVTWVYISEIYPMEIRGGAMAFATTVGWVSSFITVVSSQLLASHQSLMYGILTVFHVIEIIFIYKCIPETKGITIGSSPLFAARLLDEEMSSTRSRTSVAHSFLADES